MKTKSRYLLRHVSRYRERYSQCNFWHQTVLFKIQICLKRTPKGCSPGEKHHTLVCFMCYCQYLLLRPNANSLVAGVLMLRKILGHRQATHLKYRSEDSWAWYKLCLRPWRGAKANTLVPPPDNIMKFSFWLSKLDWPTLGLCKNEIVGQEGEIPFYNRIQRTQHFLDLTSSNIQMECCAGPVVWFKGWKWSQLVKGREFGGGKKEKEKKKISAGVKSYAGGHQGAVMSLYRQGEPQIEHCLFGGVPARSPKPNCIPTVPCGTPTGIWTSLCLPRYVGALQGTQVVSRVQCSSEYEHFITYLILGPYSLCVFYKQS